MSVNLGRLAFMKPIVFSFLALVSVPGVTFGEAAEVTFSRDVAPIVYEHCTNCHREGGGAPFHLTNYAQFRKRAKQVREVVTDRFMPPWHAVPTDYRFGNDLSLTDDELAVIQRWVDGGAEEGNAADLPPMPDYVEGWELGQPDVVLSMDEGFPVPAEGPDIYRYFGFDLDLPEDRWVRALEYQPGARSVAHHALVFTTPSGSWKPDDERDPGVGFEEWHGQREGSERIISWAIGMNARVFPEGVGVRIKRGQDLVLQTHLHPSGKAESERSSIGIYFADRVPERESIEVQIPQSFGSVSGIVIPAGQENYTLRESFVLPAAVRAYATLPHAHYIGKQFELTATFPDGAVHELLRIEDWDFAWQHLYQYESPVLLPAGTRLETVIQWDNSAENPFNPFNPPQEIAWGAYSEDEMGSIILDVVAVDDAGERALQRGLRAHSRATVENLLLSQDAALEDGLEALKGHEREVAKRVLQKHDANGDGRLNAEERAAARARYREQGFDGGLQRNQTAQLRASARR